MANVHTSSLAVYRLEMLERICKTVAKLRLSEEVEVCDVVIGINLHEEARVAKGFPSLLSFEVRANGRQNIELLDREPLLAYSKLEKRILALCHQYGTLSEDSFSGDDFSTLGKEFDDEGDSCPSFLLTFFSIILYLKSFSWNNFWESKIVLDINLSFPFSLPPMFSTPEGAPLDCNTPQRGQCSKRRREDGVTRRELTPTTIQRNSRGFLVVERLPRDDPQ